MKDRTLIKLVHDDKFISLRTFSEENGKSDRFFFYAAKLCDLEDGDFFYGMDCGNFANVSCIGDNVHIEMYWINRRPHGKISGTTQRFVIAKSIIYDCIDNGSARCLNIVESNKARIVSTHAGAAIRKACGNKLAKRALSKAMRDCFHWYNSGISLYNDGGYDMFFREQGEHGMCGGLIKHEGMVFGHDGKSHVRTYYSVHT